MESLVMGVVVGEVRGVPELFAPGQERLRAQFLQRCGVGERGNELLVDELPELACADPVSAAQVDQVAGTDRLVGAGDVVSAGGVRRADVEQGAAQHVDLVGVGQLRLLTPFRGASADWKVTSATPSIFRSAGIEVCTPSVAGHRPGLSSARWICRYSSRPGVAEMIPECGPFQWSMPAWRGW
ncbi:hypothetical protein [Streptomyces sp. NPDC002463]|uniref:hypothetical protein n=1 Tax=Streptomyces sp. NPDC002463 TaxID=3364645 RepID=UPI0036B08FE5